MSAGEDLFARARGADIAAVAGVALWREGVRLRGACPVCNDGGFRLEPRQRLFRCDGCGRSGDVIDLERAMRGGSLGEAARRLCARRDEADRRASGAGTPDLFGDDHG